MSKLLVKHWAGWITPENMENPEWLEKWKESARLAESNNMELVVFRIPKGRSGSADHNLIEKIERLLQDHTGI